MVTQHDKCGEQIDQGVRVQFGYPPNTAVVCSGRHAQASQKPPVRCDLGHVLSRHP